MTEKSSLAVAVDLVAAPNQAFAAIKERPTMWLPLLALVVSSALAGFAYMTSVDLPWFFDQQMQQNQDLTEAQREQAVRVTTSIGPLAYGAIAAVTSPIVILITLFIGALYYTAVSFFSHDGIRLKQWFAFNCWCWLPVVLGIVATLVNIVVGDARFMAQDEINPLSFGSLLAVDTAGMDALQRWLLSRDITTVWSIVLSVLGYQLWTKRSTIASAAIVLGPLVCIVAVAVLLT